MTVLRDDPVSHYLHDIARKHDLTREQEEMLFRRACNGDAEAYQQVIESHLKMVVFVARHYHSNLPLADCIEEGNLGLLHALHKFDPKYGCRFATYAVWWVRAYIERAMMNHSSIVHVPVQIRQELNVVRHAELVLTFEYNRAPTVKEIANRMETKVSHVRLLLYYAQFQHQIEDLALPDHAMSIDLAQMDYPYCQLPSPEQQLEQKQNIAITTQWLEALKPRERHVICSRFGLQGADEMTLDAIGYEFDCSKEWVRQIQVAALQKLRQYIINEHTEGELYDIITGF